MSVYHNLEDMTAVAIHTAKEHNCNYNVILFNPDENGEFSLENGSTYEMVADSYFEKERSNVKLIYKTDDLIEKENISGMGSIINEDKNDTLLTDNKYLQFNDEPYRDLFQDYPYLQTHDPYVRTEPKIGNNEQCKCGSGKKYKKCCK